MLRDLCCIFLFVCHSIYNVLFNNNKSKCICYHPTGVSKLALSTFCYPSFSVYRAPAYKDFVKTWPHLGHIISHNCDYSFDDLCVKKTNLIWQVNTISCTFRNVNCSTKTRLVKFSCTRFYWAEIWDWFHNGIEDVCVARRKDIRRIWRLPNTTHSVLIPQLWETLPLVDMFYKRTLTFVYRCLNSQSSLLKCVVRCGILYVCVHACMCVCAYKHFNYGLLQCACVFIVTGALRVLLWRWWWWNGLSGWP